MTRTLDRRRYLGDGVYVAFDGYAIVLSAEHGVTATTIVLEPAVWTALVAWVEALDAHDAERA
jgi:hypothetical protein